MAKDPEKTSDFRRRLAAIPKLDESPVGDRWDQPNPPIVRPPAPVARPESSVAPEPTYVAPEQLGQAQGPGAVVRTASERSTASPQYGDHVAVPPVEPERKRRRRWPFVLFFFVVLLVLLILIPLFMLNRTFTSIDRVSLGDALVEPLPAGTNVILVGTDSREGIDAETDNSEVILGEGISGARTDTIMVLRIEEDGNKFLSLPRDLWLPINGGDPGRINAAYAQGPEALVNTVRDELGIPISNYVEVDLAGFIDLVDAVGGVDITIEHPAFDRNSGLDLPVGGTVTLDSAQALAYVRSRFYTELIDGVEVSDPTSDLGRVQRQQEFLRALMDKMAQERNPLTLNSMSAAIGEALVIDDATSMTNALGLANSLRSSSPESVTLPTSPTTVGSASVLTLNSESPEVLAQFGG